MTRRVKADRAGVGESARVESDPRLRPGAGAGEAVARLMEVYGPRLHALASRLCASAADAEDMVQEVFVRAHRAWPGFRGESSPGTWLHAIAARSCVSRSRRGRGRGGTAGEVEGVAMSRVMPWDETVNLDLSGWAGEGLSGVSEAARREAVRAVREAIGRLPEEFRVALVLKEMLGMPIEGVGLALGVKPATVKTRVHRARLLVRKALVESKGLPRRAAVAPACERRACLALLRRKLDAMDRGESVEPTGPGTGGDGCGRCRAVFAELDLAREVCVSLGEGRLPARVRAAIRRAIRRAESEDRAGGAGSGTGRKTGNRGERGMGLKAGTA